MQLSHLFTATKTCPSHDQATGRLSRNETECINDVEKARSAKQLEGPLN